MNEQYSDTQEVVVDQTSQDLVEQIEQPLEAAPAEKPQKANSAERNFRELREKTERLERERNELARRMEQIEQRTRQPEPEPEPEFNFGDEDLVDGKTVKKMARNFEKKLQDYQRQQQAITTEAMLKSRFNDFDTVVNDASISRLKEKYPEVAASLTAQPDPYSKLSAAYTLIKDLRLADSVIDNNYDEEKAIIAKNVRQPRAAGSMSPQTGTTPLAQANDYAKTYSSKMDAQIRAEMETILKR